jgi:hypothetical protein
MTSCFPYGATERTAAGTRIRCRDGAHWTASIDDATAGRMSLARTIVEKTLQRLGFSFIIKMKMQRPRPARRNVRG